MLDRLILQSTAGAAEDDARQTWYDNLRKNSCSKLESHDNMVCRIYILFITKFVLDVYLF